MTKFSQATVAAVPPPQGDDAGDDWLLRLSVEQGCVVASGVPLAEKGALQVFVEGLLYDRDELIQTAQLPADSSDAELILAAYERTGESLLPKLRGSFVVAIVDRARQRAFVIRDPLGSHPVFYTERGSSLAFASSPHPLLAQPGVSRGLNRLALADHLCKRWPKRDETFFEAVKRVPAGWRVVVEASQVRVERQWNDPSGAIEFMTPREAGRFDEHLDRAVRRTLSAGRAGIFLSGGFDSVSVAAVAADQARRTGQPEPLALSLGFSHPGCDERLVQMSVARSLGMPFELVDFAEAAGPRGLLAEGLEFNRQLAAPLFNTWMPAYLSLVRRARMRGVRTILTGEGGDEWLGVTPFLTADLMRRGDLAGVVRLARIWHRSFDQPWSAVILGTMWRYGLRPLAGAVAASIAPDAWDRRRTNRFLRSDPSWIAPDRALRTAQRDRAQMNLAPARPKGGFYARESRVFLDDPLTSWLFEEQHHFGRRLGVRYLHPYWDADLLDHVYRTPPEILNQGDRSKGLVRESVNRRFPGLGFDKQRKVGALPFFTEILAKQAPQLAPAYSDFSALADLGVVDAAGAHSFVTTAFNQTPRVMSEAWNLVNVEAWVRTQSV